jgi:hypothetical protein
MAAVSQFSRERSGRQLPGPKFALLNVFRPGERTRMPTRLSKASAAGAATAGQCFGCAPANGDQQIDLEPRT